MILVDATTLIALGSIGELNLLLCFDRSIRIEKEVLTEVSTEPARTNVANFITEDCVGMSAGDSDLFREAEEAEHEAKGILGEETVNGDVQIIANVLRADGNSAERAVVSDDKRVRTVASGLGVTVTGTIGVIARATEEYDLTAEEGKSLVRRVDSEGLHMTGELREKAYELIERAAESE